MDQKSGIFLVNKPQGLSTNQLIQKIKKKLGIKKIGHAGTLDPLAEGLVIVLVNQATKLSTFLLNEKKEYQATIKLFAATNTGDREGVITKQEKNYEITDHQLKALTKKFNHYQYEQQVPLFSAVKIQGKKLYQYARLQETVELPKRLVTIEKFNIESYDSDKQILQINTLVSKGTYIRSLVEDVARDLGTVGHLERLIRIQSGNFKIHQAKNVENLQWSDLINLYDTLIFANYPIMIFKNLLQDIENGKTIELPLGTPEQVFIANEKKEIMAFYSRGQDDLYHCIRGGFNKN